MRTKNDYQMLYDELSPTTKDLFIRIIKQSDFIIEKLLTVYDSYIGKQLNSIELFERYAIFDPDEQSGFNRFEQLVINFLTQNNKFIDYVEKEISKGLSKDTAVLNVFFDCSLHSAKGDSHSRFRYFMMMYIRWCYQKKQERLTISMNGILEDSESPDASLRKYNLITEDVTDQELFINEIMQATNRFISKYCSDPLEKKVFIASKTWSFYHGCKPSMNELIAQIGETGYDAKYISRVYDFVNRRFAAFCIVEKIYENLSDDIHQINNKNLTILQRFMYEAKVSTYDEAKAVLIKDRVKRQQFTPAEQNSSVSDQLDEIRSFCRCRGIKFTEGTFSRNVVMKLNYSVSTRTPKRKVTTCIYSSGTYRDFSTGENGRISNICA